ELICPHRRNRTRPAMQDGRSLRRYRHRWIVERTIAWLSNFRRLVVRANTDDVPSLLSCRVLTDHTETVMKPVLAIRARRTSRLRSARNLFTTLITSPAPCRFRARREYCDCWVNWQNPWRTLDGLRRCGYFLD